MMAPALGCRAYAPVRRVGECAPGLDVAAEFLDQIVRRLLAALAYRMVEIEVLLRDRCFPATSARDRKKILRTPADIDWG